ncbi:hypothetical protein [Flavobacterium quisquiliarum]|uniref:PH domain-containing protein n=1 Tax=Flavobacterium quisquiliarum TaxID=1834436 RepID=A0ABV8VYV7_9FLAO|nr:hypothetical protein [Flavobacterium quisquiliarum]MBW1655804.1 hypothetical protein [Flavobacterium quisquiliarum]NWL01449.1 hypothetical protein [Flavobacterium collinsii]
MEIKSKFRKLFWVRIGIGFLLFIFTLYLCLNSIPQYSQLSKNPVFIVSSVFLLLFFFGALDLINVFKLIVTDQEIEKIFVISGRKEKIPFTSITSLENKKIRMQTKSGHLTDGYTLTILELDDNSTMIISPDNFSNYKEIMSAIRSKLE